MLGQRFSHYRVIGRLGVGGMGSVYEAEDMDAPRVVAVKFLIEELADDPDAMRRLTREAAVLASLEHPHICEVIEVGHHRGQPFLVMERVDGLNLRGWRNGRRIAATAAVTLARQIAEALQAAHAAGIVHRDVKPGNIMVSEAGLVKVLDFGLARHFIDPGSGEPVEYGSTMPGRPVGTPSYMAPERIRQERLDPRSDLFSLGVVMYELLSAELPFRGDSPADTAMKVLDEAPASLRSIAPDAPRELERVVLRLLEKSPDARYGSADALLRDLIRLEGAQGAKVR